MMMFLICSTITSSAKYYLVMKAYSQNSSRFVKATHLPSKFEKIESYYLCFLNSHHPRKQSRPKP